MMEAIYPPSVLPKEEQMFVRRCVDVLVTLSVLYGFNRDGFSLSQTYNHWIYCSSVMGDSLKFVKYKLAAYYVSNKSAVSKKQRSIFFFEEDKQPVNHPIDELLELPISNLSALDNPNCLMGGKFYRWSRLLMRRDLGLFDSFITSVLQAKKGMPRPNSMRLRRAEIDAFKTLTTPVPLPPQSLFDWADVSDRWGVDQFLNTGSFANQLRRTVREIFNGAKYSDADRQYPFFPSTSANYINNRQGGGALGLLFDDANLARLHWNDDVNIHSRISHLDTNEDLISLNYHQLKSKSSKRKRLIRKEIYDNTDLPDVLIDLILQYDDSPKEILSEFPTVDFTALQDHFSSFMERLTNIAMLEQPLSLPLALAEPLKTRVITKGPGVTYTVLKPLQRKLWSVLKEHKSFRLIGTPVSAEILQDQLGAKLPIGQGFLSVDYKDATNQLHSWVSEVIANELSDVLGLTPNERTLFLRSLTGHILQSPEIQFVGEQEHVLGVQPMANPEHILPQQRGQLMGSVTSFPILCIANATILRWSVELDQRKTILLRDCPLTVNGDDGVIKCSPQGLRLWKQIANFCGLEPSVGKVYYSRSFLNMNSQSFNYFPSGAGSYYFWTKEPNGAPREVSRTKHFESVPMINLGLLFGLKRSGKGEVAGLGSDTISDNISSRAHQLINECPSKLTERVMCQYIHINKKYLSKYRIPWFLPRNLGGIGLPIVGKYTPTDRDLRFCRLIYQNPDLLKVPSLPPNTPWRVWEAVQKRFPQRVLTHAHGNCSYDQLWGMACVELLFRNKFSSYFKGDHISENSLRYYRQLENLWKKSFNCVKKGVLKVPEPFTIDTLPVVLSTTHIKQINIISRYDLLFPDNWGQYTDITNYKLKSWGYHLESNKIQTHKGPVFFDS